MFVHFVINGIYLVDVNVYKRIKFVVLHFFAAGENVYKS